MIVIGEKKMVQGEGPFSRDMIDVYQEKKVRRKTANSLFIFFSLYFIKIAHQFLCLLIIDEKKVVQGEGFELPQNQKILLTLRPLRPIP